jgi:ABC-type sugar transport system ATPase subunit
MDEPFTNIDVSIKFALIQEIKAIVHNLKIPTIYVTHYANEAFNMADKIMILHNGYVVEDGTKDEIMLKPKAELTKSLIQSLQF